MPKPPCGSARPAQPCRRPANPRRRSGASGRPQAPRACDDSRPRGAPGDSGPRDGNDRFSEAYRDAGLPGGLGRAPRHPATPRGETCKMGARRVSRTGSSASRPAPCRSPKPSSPAWARLPGRRGGRTDRCAGRGSRYRPRSAMVSASSNRIAKRMHKTGFRLGQPATLGLRLSRFHDFPLSGDLPTRGMACRGCAPADADVHGHRPSGGTFRGSSRRCWSQW